MFKTSLYNNFILPVLSAFRLVRLFPPFLPRTSSCGSMTQPNKGCAHDKTDTAAAVSGGENHTGQEEEGGQEEEKRRKRWGRRQYHRQQLLSLQLRLTYSLYILTAVLLSIVNPKLCVLSYTQCAKITAEGIEMKKKKKGTTISHTPVCQTTHLKQSNE